MLNQKKLYVCKRISVEKNEYGIEKATYGKPQLYHFLYMPASSQLDIQLYGEVSSKMQIAYVRSDIYQGVFHKGDRCYLIDEDMQNIDVALTDTNCENANYEIYSAPLQNMYIKITFQNIK